MIVRRRLRLLVGLAPLLLLLAAGVVRADPPARVGHLTAIEGSVSFAPAGESEWTDAPANRPLTRGDRLWNDRGTRAEVQIGSSAVRLDGQTRIEITTLDDQSAQLSVTQGSVFVHVRSLPEGENVEVDTPNLAYRAAYPGDYRIDVDPTQGTTRVTIHSGMGGVYGENGQTQTLGGGQQATFRGRALVAVGTQESPPQDAFDRWAFERNRREDQSIAARYVPREVVGYQQLDPYGQWRRNEQYGAIWFPQGLPAKWAPYRQGRWDWVSPWGWTWIDDAPWGFAPFHYGRWAFVDDQWAWVPGRLTERPVYAPALVAFVGGSTSEAAWFPLAPGEAWRPPYAASALYISNVNHGLPVTAPASYAYQRRTEALTSIALADFQRGRPNGSGWWRMASNLLTSAPIVPPPPIPARAITLAHETKPARSTPPAAPATQAAPEIAQVAPPAAAPRRPAMPPSAAAPAPAVAPAATPAPAKAATTVTATAPPAVTPPAPARPQTARAPAVATAAAPAVKPAAPAARRLPPPAAAAPQSVARRSGGDIDPTPPARVARVTRPAPERVRTHATPARTQAAAREAANARAERLRREQSIARAEQVQRQQAARRQAEAARREAVAQARHREQLQRAAQAKREELARREAKARADERVRREMHMAHVEQARRVADRDAQALREQRAQREQQLRRAALDREQAQREASEREQQVLTEQWRRDRQAWEQRQGQVQRQQRPRPDLRQDGSGSRQPEVWQRGIPILNSGPTS